MTKRVVIADDVAEIRRLLTRMFRDQDDFVVVGEAANGDEALSKCQDHAPDVVILDINMPVRSGLEVLPDIREAVPDALIVIFSGFSSASMTDRLLQLGANAYIEKGTPSADILGRLRDLVDSD